MAMIEGLTHLGLGKVDDGRTLLPRVLPGEEVAVAQDGTVRIITPSPDRVSAPCKHFKNCGGCAMQHANDAFVANWKLDIVKKAMSAQRIETTFRDIVTSPAQSRRRAKLAGKRTKSGAMLGFHAKGTHTLIPVPECQLLTPKLMAAFPMLEQLVVISASRKAEIALTVTETAAGLDIFVETEKPLTPELRAELALFAQENDIARLVWPEEPVVTMNPPVQFFGATAVVPPPGAFLQATKHGEAALLAAVEEITAKASRVVDLFAGCGTFSLPLSARAEVHAVEGDKDMITALDRGWREGKNLKRVTSEARDLFRRPLEPDELRKFGAAVIDPPRAGAEAQIETLAASEINVIAMVSCNPVTFARDAVTLQKAGFTLDWVQVVDQFRWSAHVEVVGCFTRK
ncbi:MAG: class I SAM-dependent RNA methyltransferase [Yoonia sp.]|jgi:23S rRNA (uracil1939-C5)-methyltransferase|nr:class I SAM-dependent RNA methyltransferase [Yoonia sp.]